ncbi:MAG: alkaline phosphatase family protein [Actinomycetia bacterium]|nr:alkaline phosphatase family protein [Actinomycetes bacterium]MCP4222876.1 alkaline phosphatase family protein [Actinomycetes bacterium]MCP5034344.1 alkaline phosphatase family protein [Actinomycetes bacterium]
MEPPTLPTFGHGCITDLLPAFLGIGGDSPLPVAYPTSGPRVLLVLDGLGWEQMKARPELTPTLSAMVGGPITTTAPSTTATALTSITTGLTPSEHGLVGYRMRVDDDVLNCLRWGTGANPDARAIIPPTVLQPIRPFMGEVVPLVTRAEFTRSGFSEAHLRGGRFVGYRTSATMVHEIARQIREGEPLVYAYYDGVDKVAHEYGLGSVYDAEVAYVDRLVADVVSAVPTGTTVLVTADHGQVDCGGGLVQIAEEVLAHTAGLSGEGRFRWLHAEPGRIESLYEAATTYHGIDSWVVGIEQMADEHWFGHTLGEDVRSRLGDVALLPIGPHAFDDPADGGPFQLIGRHGSLTSAEMLVPCLIASV